jgi:hypothetical protein
MSGSTSILDLIAAAQAAKEVTANALFDAGSPAVLYGRRASTTTALTWGYYGGMLNISGTPTAVANGTLVLTASTTNYVVAHWTTGVVSVSTATTNWNNVAVYMRLYAIVTGASTVTSYTDHRAFLIHDLDFALGVAAGNAVQVDQAVTATTRATTTTLGTSLNHELSNTGADITAFHGIAGVTNHCRATGAGKIVNSAGLIVTQGLADITTAAGDTFDVEMLTATTCRIKNYVRATERKIAQVVATHVGTVATGTTVIPLDNTIPQNTEGDQYMTLAITPTNANSLLRIDVSAHASSSVNNDMILALFQDAIANALSAMLQTNTASWSSELNLSHTMTSGTTSAITFKVRIGGAGAGTTTFNGSAGNQFLGGIIASSIIITEYLP